MTSFWKRINTKSRLKWRSSSSSASDAQSAFGTVLINTYLFSSEKKHKILPLSSSSSSPAAASDKISRVPSWYRVDITRESAICCLSGQAIGSFLIRSSSSEPGCLVLSVRVPNFNNRTGVSHYLITRTPHGTFKIKGMEKEWSNVTSLVTHHSVMKEMLPCTLRLSDGRNDDDDDCDEEQEGRGDDEPEFWK